jgi:hypothetical protein
MSVINAGTAAGRLQPEVIYDPRGSGERGPLVRPTRRSGARLIIAREGILARHGVRGGKAMIATLRRRLIARA